MKSQSQYSQNRHEINLNALSNKELQALIAGLMERKRALIAALDENPRPCDQCSNRGACGPRCQAG